jgi:hypothetical protein
MGTNEFENATKGFWCSTFDFVVFGTSDLLGKHHISEKDHYLTIPDSMMCTPSM